jgi:hypothetical protein
MWKNIVELDKSHMTLRRVRIACWIPKAANSHSEYVMLIAFPTQQWLQERLSILRYTYITCLLFLLIFFFFFFFFFFFLLFLLFLFLFLLFLSSFSFFFFFFFFFFFEKA